MGPDEKNFRLIKMAVIYEGVQFDTDMVILN